MPFGGDRMKVLYIYIADRFYANIKEHLAKLEQTEAYEINDDDINTYIVSLLNHAMQHGVKV